SVEDGEQRHDALGLRRGGVEAVREGLQLSYPWAVAEPPRNRRVVWRHDIFPSQRPGQHSAALRHADPLARIVGEACAFASGHHVEREAVGEDRDWARTRILRVEDEVGTARDGDAIGPQLDLAAEEPAARADGDPPRSVDLRCESIAGGRFDLLLQLGDEAVLELALEHRALRHRANGLDALERVEGLDQRIDDVERRLAHEQW